MTYPFTDMLQVKVMDPDERVRTTVSKLYGQVDFEIILHHVPRDHLQNLAGRATDKKVSFPFDLPNTTERSSAKRPRGDTQNPRKALQSRLSSHVSSLLSCLPKAHACIERIKTLPPFANSPGYRIPSFPWSE